MSKRNETTPLGTLFRTGVAAMAIVGAVQQTASAINWTVSAGGAWETGTNWAGGTAPGSTSTTTNTDAAVFNVAGASTQIITLSENRYLGSIALSKNGSYTITSDNGSGLTLSTNADSVQIYAAVTGTNTLAVNVPLTIVATDSVFSNLSTDANTVLQIAGDVTANGAFRLQLKGANTGNNVFSGSFLNSTYGILKLNAGKWTMSGTSSNYKGTTVVQEGTLVAGGNVLAGSNGVFGNPETALNRIITVGNNSTGASRNPALLIGGAYTIDRAVTVGGTVTTSTYTLGGANTTGTSQFTGNITLNQATILQAAAGGTTSFNTGTWTTNNKAITIGTSGNTGTVAIGNNLSTTGGVTVAYGQLSVGGTLMAPVTINSGATLTGAGTIVGTVAINGTISPGSSPGTLTTGAETWSSGGSYTWEINNATGAKGVDQGWDWISSTGALAMPASGNFTINITGLSTGDTLGSVANFDKTQNYSWIIASGTGITDFDAARFTLDAGNFITNNSISGSVSDGSFAIAQSGNDIVLNYTGAVVPEPGTLGLLSAVVVGALTRRRRKH